MQFQFDTESLHLFLPVAANQFPGPARTVSQLAWPASVRATATFPEGSVPPYESPSNSNSGCKINRHLDQHEPPKAAFAQYSSDLTGQDSGLIVSVHRDPPRFQPCVPLSILPSNARIGLQAPETARACIRLIADKAVVFNAESWYCRRLRPWFCPGDNPHAVQSNSHPWIHLLPVELGRSDRVQARAFWLSLALEL
jgi:hypothetical protein